MSTELKDDLRKAIITDPTLEAASKKLRQCKEQGVTREEILALLEAMRSENADEATEDRILELMDCVVGFCSPHARIWDD